MLEIHAVMIPLDSAEEVEAGDLSLAAGVGAEAWVGKAAFEVGRAAILAALAMGTTTTIVITATTPTARTT